MRLDTADRIVEEIEDNFYCEATVYKRYSGRGMDETSGVVTDEPLTVAVALGQLIERGDAELSEGTDLRMDGMGRQIIVY